MPILVVCPKCSAKLNAPDAAAGKKVKCPRAGCGTIIAVPEPLSPDSPNGNNPPPIPRPALKQSVQAKVETASPPKTKSLGDDDDARPPQGRPAKSRLADEEDERPIRSKNRLDDDEDDEEDERPRNKRRRIDDDEEDERPRSKKNRDDDDEDDDDRPRRKQRDDDDDDDDDRPRKKKKQKKGGIPAVAIVAIALGGLLLFGGVGYGIYYLATSDEKESTASSAGSNSNPGKGGTGTNPNTGGTGTNPNTGGTGTNPNAGGTGTNPGTPVGPSTRVPAGWIELKPAGGGFKTYVPLKPKEITEADLKIFEAEDHTLKMSCTVFVQTPKIAIVPEKRREVGETVLRLIMTSVGAKELSRKDAALAGLTATEFVFEAPADKGPPGKGKGPKLKQGNPGRGVFRVLVTDTKVIIAGVMSDTGMPPSEWLEGFFDNFQLVK